MNAALNCTLNKLKWQIMDLKWQKWQIQENKMSKENTGMYLSANAHAAGKSFKSFQKLMRAAIDHAPITVKFTCPEVIELERELAHEKQKAQKLVEALEHLVKGTALGNTKVCEIINMYAMQALKAYKGE